MTTVASGERLSVSELTFTDKLNEVAMLPMDRIDDHLAMEAYEILLQPEKRLPGLVDGLSDLYIDRCATHRMQYRGKVEESVQFATRDRTESYLEELYTIVDTYGPNNKGWQSRSYILDRFVKDASTGDVARYKICIDPEVAVRTYTYNEVGQAQLLNEDEAYVVLGSFVSEALLSASLMADESLAGRSDIAVPVRTAEQRAAANADAKAKLQRHHTELGAVVSSIPNITTDYGQQLLHEHYMSQLG